MEIEKVKTESGTIVNDPKRGGIFYLRFHYRGKDFTKSLETTALSIAKRAAPKVRKEAEADRDSELLRAVEGSGKPSDKVQVEKDLSRQPLVTEIYRIDPQDMGFLQEFYPEATTNKNTRYDNEKLLKLYLGKLAGLAGLKTDDLSIAHLTPDRIKSAFQSVKETHAKKTQQKVSFILKKLLKWMMERKRIPSDLKLLTAITDATPSNVAVIKGRQKDIPEEIWDHESDFLPIINACKEGHSLTLPLDYEIYWVSRYMGLPPSDIYQLLPDDFGLGEQGLELNKERAKNDDSTIARYHQPIRKGLEEDKETERIIRARLKVCKNGERLFAQAPKVTRANNGTQDDKTRWVSNFSGRRIALQKELGLTQKGIKGLRATFVTFWIKKHVPPATIESWCGWTEGSTMKSKFYSTKKDSSYWTLPT